MDAAYFAQAEAQGLFAFIFFLAPVFFFAFIGFLIYNQHKKAKREQAEFEQWVTTQSFKLGADASMLAAATFRNGSIDRGCTGVLQTSANAFGYLSQTETRGSGKNRRVYNRSIIAVDIPDTQLQLIVNSKINSDGSSGGNLQSYAKSQRLTLEGDFGNFFDLYMPETTQSESLTLLAPDSMLYILVNLADYDIEINGNKLFVYRYKRMSTNEVSELLMKIDGLLEKMRLRKDDVRAEKLTEAIVARTATDAASARRSLKKDTQYLVIFAVVGYFLAQFVNHPVARLVGFGLFGLLIVRALIDAAAEARLRRKYHDVVAHYSPDKPL